MNTPQFFRQFYDKDKFVLVIFSVIVILSIYQVSSSYYILLDNQKDAVLQRLMVVANSAAMMIDGDEHQALSSKYNEKNAISTTEQDSVYQKLHLILREISDKNNITTPIYTMVYNDESDEFEFIITSSAMTYFRHMFVNYPKELKEKISEGGVINEYESENGVWLSAFAPIKNSLGETIAVVQSDENFNEFITSARTELYKKIGVVLLVFIPFSIFLYTYIRKTLERDKEQQVQLEEQNEEIQVQNETIKATNSKLEAANKIIEERNLNLDKQVKKRTIELERANEDLQTFLYRSSHDIQGPIASLRGIFQMVSSDKDHFDQYLRMMKDTVNQLDKRIRGVNAVFEIKSKKLNRKTIDIQELIEDIADEEALNNNCSQWDCKFDVGRNDKMEVDEDLIKVVFKELIRNTMMFNSDQQDLEMSISIKNKGVRFYEITFQDNGKGIETDGREGVFQMFTRFDEKSEGSGLGLYAVKMAVQKLQGKIKLLSRDQGTAFQIILPTY